MEGQQVSKKTKLCGRLALSVPTKRRLWAESGGYCQNPECAIFLFTEEETDFAEMAHVIAASEGGPRDKPNIELSDEDRALPANIAVLCANCHTKVDKAPATYTAEMMHIWKENSANDIRALRGTPQFSTRSEARAHIELRLDENRAIFNSYGPSPEHNNDARASQWRRHVVRTIIPNNAQVHRVLKKNRDLLKARERETADLFSIHVTEFAARHILGDWAAGGTRFPDGMTTILED